jgi:hypothetical protein
VSAGDPSPNRFRFEVRSVNEHDRVYRYVDDFPAYVTACMAADFARELVPVCHFVVWDSRLKKILYDSRKVTR